MHFRYLFKMTLKAAGVVIFREKPPVSGSKQFEYLLLKCANKLHWTPPKGHLENQEEERAAAIREVKEEAGLDEKDYEFVNGYEETLQYNAWGKSKIVKYWLAKITNDDAKVVLSKEHTEFDWFSVKRIKEGLNPGIEIHDGTKSILFKAEQFLLRKQ